MMGHWLAESRCPALASRLSAWLYDLLKASHQESGGLRPAKECAVEVREQRRPDRCSETGNASPRRTPFGGLPWRKRRRHPEGTGPQLSDDHEGSHLCHESPESSLSEPGYSSRRQACVRTAASGRVAQQAIWSGPSPSCGTALSAARHAL